ncbi:MAG: TetR/AcrR family transcriptional regulator [bacterium]|nr:TetR/AcrR family transcriptional regulator [bacterium]
MSDNSSEKKYYIHTPKQHRSLMRYHHILHTAANMFARVGYDNVGTNHIADEAGISVGSFYQFFSGKEALVDALTAYYITELQTVLPRDIQKNTPIALVVRTMLENVFEFARQQVAFAYILSPANTGHLSQVAIQLHLTLEGWVEGLLTVYHPALSADKIHLCAAAGMGIVKGMMMMAQPPDDVPFDVVITEMVEALMAYVDNFVLRHQPR